MARPAGPGKAALLDAGTRLLSKADGVGWEGLSANAVVAEASMSKGAFFHHFPTRRSYALELHARFHDEIERAIAQETAALPPGPERLRRGIMCYLDFCLQHGEAKAFLFSARADGDLTAAVSAMNRRFALLVEPDLTVTGWASAHEVAALAVAAIAEVALIEKDLRNRSRKHRTALLALLRLDQST